MRCILMLVLLLAALVLPGCLTMNFIPAGPPITAKPAPGVEVVRFPSEDGLMLEGRMYPPLKEAPKLPEKHARSVVLFCHGVQDNADSTEQAECFLAAGYRLFIFDYRGFGNSDAADLSNEGFAEDAAAALVYLRSRPDVDPRQIVVYGHSMGGVYAMAAGAAGAKAGTPVAGVISACAFSNWWTVSNDLAPGLGFFLGGVTGPEPTDFVEKLGKTPLLIVHVHDDEIPYSHALALMDAARKAEVPTDLYLAGTGGHVVAFWWNDELRKVMTGWAGARLDGPPQFGPDW